VKSNYISSLQVGDELTNEAFLLQEIVPRTTKDGRPYLLYNLRDKTGQLGGVFWDVPDYVKSWAKPGIVALVTGRVNSCKDVIQVMATDMNKATNPDMTDYLPSSLRPQTEMLADLRNQIERLAEPWQSLVRHLLLAESFLPAYSLAPAARAMHHAYVGGLLEHSLSMAEIARKLAKHYPYVNSDLVITGALLHDMGKTAEYTTDGTFNRTEDGRLVGHIVRAIVMLEKAAAEIDFPEDKLRQLVHLIASHHGTHEWGSPTIPQTLEAVLLHQIDLLDSRIQGFLDHVREDSSEDGWTAKDSRMFGTRLQRPSALNPDHGTTS
jgi:3'-5' exoribonuclease